MKNGNAPAAPCKLSGYVNWNDEDAMRSNHG